MSPASLWTKSPTFLILLLVSFPVSMSKSADFDIETGKETNKRIRNVGDFVHKEAGDIHMEKGGPEGALVLFMIYDPSGKGNLAESITKSGKVISSSNIKNILKRISN